MKQQVVILFISAILIGFLPAESDTVSKVSWKTLSKVNWVLKDGDYHIQFSDEVEKLHGQTIEIAGFMFPLKSGSGEEEFLLSANPISGCFYCAPGSSESFIMIYPDQKIDFTFDPIALEGTFELVRDDFYGIVYQLKDATFKQSL